MYTHESADRKCVNTYTRYGNSYMITLLFRGDHFMCKIPDDWETYVECINSGIITDDSYYKGSV